MNIPPTEFWQNIIFYINILRGLSETYMQIERWGKERIMHLHTKNICHWDIINLNGLLQLSAMMVKKGPIYENKYYHLYTSYLYLVHIKVNSPTPLKFC